MKENDFPENESFRARKKPVEIDVFGPVEERKEIHTREGILFAVPGDYIIRGIEGEIYPIDPGVFERTYEKVE